MLLAACAVVLGAFLTSCGPSYRDYFAKRYSVVAGEATVVYLSVDATYFRDVSGGEHVIHVRKSQRMLEWLSEIIPELLTQKDYVASGWRVESIGLTAGPADAFHVFDGSLEESPGWTSIDDLRVQRMPMYLRAPGADEESIQIITNLHHELYDSDLNPFEGGYYLPPVVATVRDLRLPGDSLLVVTRSSAEEFPLGKKMAQFLATLPFAIGYQGPVYEPDNVHHAIFVFNPEGKLLWRHEIVSPSVDLASKSDVIEGMKVLVDGLPGRSGGSPVSDGENDVSE